MSRFEQISRCNKLLLIWYETRKKNLNKTDSFEKVFKLTRNFYVFIFYSFCSLAIGKVLHYCFKYYTNFSNMARKHTAHVYSADLN